MKKIGKSIEDIRTEKMIQCRNIVKEIIKFGVNEEQKKQIIKLLACELENNDLMKQIVNTIKGQACESKGLISLD